MIRHIFKIIRNERRTNVWVFVEYLLIFCVLWLCCNYITSIFRTYEASPGFDLSRVYALKMEWKPGAPEDTDNYGTALTLMDRVKRHPDVEQVTMGTGIPYGSSTSINIMYINDNDSVGHRVSKANVTSGFFEVFQIPLTSGDVFDWQDDGDKNKAVITAFKDDLFGGNPHDSKIDLVPISQVHTLAEPMGENENLVRNVVGTAGRIINAHNYWKTHVSTTFFPLQRQDVHVLRNDIVIRVKAGTGKDFPEKFKKEMEEQLSIGPYFLAFVKSLKEIKDERSTVITGKMNSAYAVTTFLIINIFLGVLGTFWSRTQSRRNEIGLRVAVGSSKNLIRKMFISEALFLLLPASIIGTAICLALFGGDLLDVLGIPTIDRKAWKIGWEQDVINFVLTFGFLAVVSIMAVLYPANQAAGIPPAEALREE
jgi:putative ABC transport system permease protein